MYQCLTPGTFYDFERNIFCIPRFGGIPKSEEELFEVGGPASLLTFVVETRSKDFYGLLMFVWKKTNFSSS